MILRKLALVVMALGAGVMARADTINADSPSRTDVAAALALAAFGDVVVVPAGSANWAAGSYGTYAVTIPAGVTLQGAGIDVTTITLDLGHGSGTTRAVKLGDNSRLTGFTFADDATAYSTAIVQTGSAQDFRIDHCKFTGIYLDGIRTGDVQTGALGQGVIDNCLFVPTTVPGVQFQCIEVSGNARELPPAEANPSLGSWVSAPAFGTSRGVYIEDNEFDCAHPGDAAIEMYVGAIATVRNNTGTNFQIGMHGNDSSTRSAHGLAFYNNTITNTVGSDIQSIVYVRGGTALVLLNDITASGSGFASENDVSIQQYRSSNLVNLTSGQLFGINSADGNLPYHATRGVGTHTGSNDAAVLVDSGQAWETDELLGSGNADLTDDLHSYVVWNTTKGVCAQILANDATSVTVDRFIYALVRTAPSPSTSGTSLRIDPGRSALFPATPFNARIWGRTTDSSTYEIVTVTNISNSANYSTLTITRGQEGTTPISLGTFARIAVESGDRLTWDTGDAYKVTFGYPGVDQPGWAGPTSFSLTGGTQVLTPIRVIGNTFNGSAEALSPVLQYNIPLYTDVVQPQSSQFIVEDREWYADKSSTFDGSSGNGMGTLAEMAAITPSHTGVGYWATDAGDDGVLYEWDGDSWEVYFTPYAYPHPLRDDASPAPDAPTGVTLAANSSLPQTGGTLNWTDASDNEAGFEIDRSTNGSDWTHIATTIADVTSYIDRTGLANTTYHYRVRAVNGAGDSANVTPTPASIATGAAAPVYQGRRGF